MADKDLLVVISEMLHKQDLHSEILNEHSKILNEHSAILNKQTEILSNVNTTLNTFMDVSVKQFEQNQKFNKQFLTRLGSIEKLLDKDK